VRVVRNLSNQSRDPLMIIRNTKSLIRRAISKQFHKLKPNKHRKPLVNRRNHHLELMIFPTSTMSRITLKTIRYSTI